MLGSLENLGSFYLGYNSRFSSIGRNRFDSIYFDTGWMDENVLIKELEQEFNG